MFLKIAFVWEVSTCACMFVSAYQAINNQWHGMNPIWFPKSCTAFIWQLQCLISRCGLRNKVCHKTNVIRARVDNVVLTVDKSISISFILRVVENSCSQVRNKTKHFSYKGGCGICVSKAFNRRAGLGYRSSECGLLVIYH